MPTSASLKTATDHYTTVSTDYASIKRARLVDQVINSAIAAGIGTTAATLAAAVVIGVNSW